MKQKGTLADRFKRSLGWFGRGAAKAYGGDARRVTFRLMYERFREILVLNDHTLERIADIEEFLGSQRRFSLDAMVRRIRKAAMDVFLMVKNLNQIAEKRHEGLYETLNRLNDELESEMAIVKETISGRLVVPLTQLRASDAPLVGAKMANLGEIRAVCGFAVPDGFAITTEAFLRFMAAGGLWEKCERLDAGLETGDSQAFSEACHALQATILNTPVTADVAGAMRCAFDEHFPDGGALVAMRSSAVGEDSAISSHAGLYRTELNTDGARLIDAYRAVLASTFSPTAVAYRFQRGIPTRDALMAVGCVRMIEPRCAGIMFSRLPDEPDPDVVMISATAGIAAGIAAGEERPETWVVTAGRISDAGGSLLTQEDVAALINAARRLEAHFGTPQDIEWAIDGNGALLFLQARPMTAVRLEDEPPEAIIRDRAPLIEGGFVACPGIGSGPVVIVSAESDLSPFSEGGVLVSRHSSPTYAQVMARCAAIVTDVGSPTGHMSSLAREFGIPTIVGLDGATQALRAGQLVTVDARACRVFDGVIPAPVASPRSRQAPPDSPALERLRRMARLVTPLTMTDPASPDFRPEKCRSLHDVTRYVHEKVFEVMFHYGDIASADRDNSVHLQAKLPIRVEVFDVGGGIVEGARPDSRIRPEDIRSVPMRAFLEGLLDPRIRWDLPRPVSVRGFLSVLGESMTGPPVDAGQIGRLSYAIISDRYMNFSTKAGYHFSTIDTYCGRSVNKNYIHFRFSGGAADVERRQRRVRFVSRVVTALDFSAQARGEMLVARLSKYNAQGIRARLVALGRLTLCARQLDMLMDNDASPDLFAQAFIAGEWHKF